MAERIGKYTLKFGSRPGIIASAAIVGSKEGDGPLGGSFDEIITDGTFGEKTWEKAESAFQHRAVVKAIEKSGTTAADIDMLMAGDLLSQCSGSAFGARDLGIPFVGLYGACSTITAFLQDTKTQPEDLDLILTGDLGYVGSTLLRELMRKQEHIDITTRHNDCGLMLYRLNEQDVNSGGSGCGCSAAVVCSHIVSEMRSGRLNKVLFVGTGALLSAVSPLQGETVPSIAHAVLLTN